MHDKCNQSILIIQTDFAEDAKQESLNETMMYDKCTENNDSMYA